MPRSFGGMMVLFSFFVKKSPTSSCIIIMYITLGGGGSFLITFLRFAIDITLFKKTDNTNRKFSMFVLIDNTPF